MARLVALLLVLLPALARAQERPGRAPFRYFTQLGDEVLARVDAVLLGKVESVTAVRGSDVVRVSVATWFVGERGVPPGEVTLLAQHGDFFAGTEQLLFLKRFEGGPRYLLHNRVTCNDPDFEAKLRVLEQNVALRKLEREEERRRQVRKLLYDDAAARDGWTRWHAFHELEHVRRAHADLVTREDREELTRLADRSADPSFRKALLKLLQEWTS